MAFNESNADKYMPATDIAVVYKYMPAKEIAGLQTYACYIDSWFTSICLLQRQLVYKYLPVTEIAGLQVFAC